MGGYGSPEYLVSQEHNLGLLTLNAADATNRSKLYAAVKKKLTAAYCVITGAGTAAAAAFKILNGTSSIGIITIGTQTAGAIATAVLDSGAASIAAGSVINITNTTSDTQGAGYVVLRWQDTF